MRSGFKVVVRVDVEKQSNRSDERETNRVSD